MSTGVLKNIKMDDFISRIDLDVIRVNLDSRLSRHEIRCLENNVEVGRFFDNMLDTVSFTFRAHVLGEKQKPIKLGPYPKSWWQMFKRDVMPKWFTKKFPVKSEEFIIDASVLYPDLKISVPATESRVSVIFNKRPIGVGFTE